MKEKDKVMQLVIDEGFTNEEEANDFVNENILIYEDCLNMGEVAAEIAEEQGLLDEIPSHLQYYFDYEAYGRDLEIEGTFYYMGSGVYIQILN